MELIQQLFQYIIYDGKALIADVGGYLGLLIGQSIYGLYELLTLFCKGKEALKTGLLPE